MRRVIFFSLILTLFLISGCGGTSIGTPEIMTNWPPDRPVLVQAPKVDQGTIIKYIFLIGQPGWMNWAGFHPDQRDDLWGALSAIYLQAEKDNDQVLLSGAIHAMGATGIVEFLPMILDALDSIDDLYRSTAVSALRGIPSDYAVYQLIQELDHNNVRCRHAAAYSLGTYKFYANFGVRQHVVNKLLKRLEIEEVGWLRTKLEEAVERLVGD